MDDGVTSVPRSIAGTKEALTIHVVVPLQVLYAAQSTLGYHVGTKAHGLANNFKLDSERAALPVNSIEYGFR